MSENITFQEAVEFAGIEDIDMDKIPTDWPTTVNTGTVARVLKTAGVPAGRGLIDAAKAVIEFAPEDEPAVEAQATINVVGAVADEPDEANPYLANMGAGFGTATTLNLDVPRMERIAEAAEAHMLLSLGLDEMFAAPAWDKLSAMQFPLSVSDAGYAWDAKRRQGGYVPLDDLEQIFRDFPALFGPQWSRAMDIAAQLEAGQQAQDILSGALRVDLGQSGEIASLGLLLPHIAQSVSNNVSRGSGARIPSVAKGAIEMVNDLKKILMSQELQEAANVWEGPKKAEAGAVEFLRRFGPQLSNADVGTAMQAAVTGKNLIMLLSKAGDNKSPKHEDLYKRAFGTMALQWKTLYGLCFAEPMAQVAAATPQHHIQGVAGRQAGGFRPEGTVANPQARNWTVGIDFRFKLRFGRN